MEPAKPGTPARLYETLFLIFFILLLAGIRLHSFPMPLERDEANYAYVGERLFAGDRMYIEQWDHQPPAIFAFYGLLGKIFGTSPGVFRWTATVFSACTLVLIFLIMRSFYSSVTALFAAALPDALKAARG